MEHTQKSILGSRLFLIAAFAVTAWALVYKTGVATSDEAGIVLHLPEQVGPWHGMDILFCPDRKCGGQYTSSQLEDPTTCPKCGAKLGNMNWAERSMLPPDTGLVRKYYSLPDNRNGIHATIVLSGDDRSSIHRPEVCMTAAGNEIVHEGIIQIPLEGRTEPLEVMVLDMTRSIQRENGTPATYNSFYAYWFVGKDRETADHVVRMLWMGFDRIFHGVSHRWAYIALAGERNPISDDHLQTIADFASHLHPALLKPK